MHLCLVFCGSLTVLGLLLAEPVRAQHFTVLGDEFMDTTSVRPARCPPLRGVRYYQVAGKYPRSSATLATEAQVFVQRLRKPHPSSGYITFRFIVDCKGQRLPRTQVLQTTATYQPTHFEPGLVETLYQYLQTLTEWPVAKAPAQTSYMGYLTFKIQDGNVVAVAP